MTVEQMREAIAGVYKGWKWKDKVANMPEDQVMAIYFKFQSSGVLDGTNVVDDHSSRKSNTKEETKFVKPYAEQLSIFDVI